MALTFTLLTAHPSFAWEKAKVSYHPSYKGYSTAARGVRMGTVYEFKTLKGGKIRVTVVDANGGRMKGWGRKFDLSPKAFKAIFNGLGRGVGHVQYRKVTEGSGRLIPR